MLEKHFLMVGVHMSLNIQDKFTFTLDIIRVNDNFRVTQSCFMILC